jgi:hypothetical protein
MKMADYHAEYDSCKNIQIMNTLEFKTSTHNECSGMAPAAWEKCRSGDGKERRICCGEREAHSCPVDWHDGDAHGLPVFHARVDVNQSRGRGVQGR